jgi:hypothetical protein
MADTKTESDAKAKAPVYGESIQVEAVQIPKLKAKNKSRYWIGTLPSCPFQNVSLAGMDFPRFVDPPRENTDGTTSRSEMKGKVVWLDEDQVNLIKKKSTQKVVRTVGQRAFLRNVEDVTYTPEPADRAMAYHVYMVRLSDDGYLPARDMAAEYPPAMAK